MIVALKTIPIKGNVFNPPATAVNHGANFVIEVGDTVEWDNQDHVLHNVVGLGTPVFSLDSFGHGKTSPVGPFSAATDANGVKYTCTLHNNMDGFIVVVLPGSHPETFSKPATSQTHGAEHGKMK